MGETTELHTHGDALPVRDGAVVRDAPPGTRAVAATEPTAAVLSKQEGSPESQQVAREVETRNADWPRRHADLDAIADEHGVEFTADATTIDDKISELAAAGISAPPKE